MARGVIFDCDGVLADSEKLSCGAWLPALARHGVASTLEEVERFLGRSDREVLEHMRRVHRADLPESLVDERLEDYYALARGRLRPFPGAREALLELQRLGFALAVASSGRPEKIAFSLGEVGLADLLPVVCSATGVARGKPAPDLFLLAAARLGLAPGRCAVVEDSVVGIAAARAARMHPVGFPSGTTAEALAEAGAECVVEDFGSLPGRAEALLGPC